ncbi:MAG: DNA-binding protein [Vitreimonas sp.]
MAAAANDAPVNQDDDLLTDEEVVARYRDRITLGTLRNWRALKIGPPYIKVGKAVLYSRTTLQAWDKRNTVACSKLG